MSSKNTEYDVIIVGCGPVGATLANYLRLYGGIKVGIFERFKDVFYAPRAMGVDDEAKRIFNNMGLLNRLVEEGHLGYGKVWFNDGTGKNLAAFTESTLGTDLFTQSCGHFYIGQFHQPSFEKMVRTEMQIGRAVTAFFEYDVLSLTDEGNRVHLKTKNRNTAEEETYYAKYVVGCDGANSTVQKEIASGFTDYNYSEDYLVVDTIVEDEIYLETMFPDGGTFTLDPIRSGIILKGQHGHVRLDFLISPALKAANKNYLEEVGDLIKARGLEPEKFKIIRHAPYTFEAKTPKQWRKGRLVVAGDAAHLTPPWSGQGLNMGFRDAVNLAFKLDLILKGKTSDKILDTYQAERIAPTLHTIEGAIETGKLMTAKNPLKIAMRSLVYYLGRKSRSMRRSLFKSWQRKPPYKEGLVGKHHQLAGTLMIQPKVLNPKETDGQLHWIDTLIGNRFALISVGRVAGKPIYNFVKEVDGKLLRYTSDFSDPSGQLLAWFAKHKIEHVIVRPDRYIYDAGNDANALCASLLGQLKQF